MMNKTSQLALLNVFDGLSGFLRRLFFHVLSHGPVPRHMAFILDGNRRFSRKKRLQHGEGHRLGYLTLLTTLRHCLELSVTHVTLFVFSIDNFNRSPSEVALLMELMLEKTEHMAREARLLANWGIKVRFAGDLGRLNKSLREAMHRLMQVTEKNEGLVVTFCVAYTATDEMVRAVRAVVGKGVVGVEELEAKLDLGECPKVDVLVRTSGETRLSNFLLWQTERSVLYAPSCLWPELGLRHLVWAVLLYQRAHPYLRGSGNENDKEM